MRAGSLGNIGEFRLPVTVVTVEDLIRVVELAQIQPEGNRVSELSCKVEMLALLLAVEIPADL